MMMHKLNPTTTADAPGAPDAPTLSPLNDRVVLREIKPREERRGSLVMPTTVAAGPPIGEILAVGPGNILPNGVRAPLAVQVGDRVVFPRGVGTEIQIAGAEYLVLRESDLLVKLTDEP